MTTIEEKIAALKEALASGASRVRYADREVQYRSLAEVRSILKDLEAERDGKAAAPRTTYASYWPD
ncbi:phage head-tail joining protein [Afifella aestuarii]|uniref:phage head-tail joining protein n=1 Tax=Afifella aestuarii TaxID=1909496 RepID=UPI000FE36E12|nr:hypothetical protein [Afifella aestuarii]